ncbi:ABC transporter permease [Mycolicibacterium austroafricanum]|uniref:ABC transporter permease n=1 Tax=Mycolicibacterium austroafricanum TaxID=39687 RepID=A0ABT8HAG6_MYCAO|nr:ABC transporter permease [Mycolicibacterium austroafricanum]MDN4517731.1 ABC transporter permease [Mycolicibacterium austroafricanum]PQP47750.1 ABC transporter permease [Mycolicibacterium austroafricanum]QRZ08880.1 ABC transporter permease [Mycolicibacterium austroafricanum]QZT70655.1 ABC transporter permease [Mycolicibacterium austroafricanum]
MAVGAVIGSPARTRAGRMVGSLGHAGAYAAVGAFAVITVIAVSASVLAPYTATEIAGAPMLAPGSAGHLLGTDDSGRDLLSRTLLGIQTSWLSALIIVAVGLLVGGLVGLVAGARGGLVDTVLMRITDGFLALPAPVLAVAIVAALGPGLLHTLIAVSIVWWPYYARIVRGEVVALMARPHIEAARLAGAGPVSLVVRHVVPGVIPSSVVAASQDVGNVILTLAALSFLGLGAPAPAAELGADTARTMSSLLSDWWIPVVPGVAVGLLSLVATVSGDGLNTFVRRR